ncbi:hypothetical protein [Paraliomyxa miuraensis]|uniref:hypothetical protein n=1 Tax=Paraliomyxa miuraensis TaxID=376150 RepID=UPI00225794C1|nr:hypothetical protein [Paraliomyxa miuraensis]MCX4241134.1 hypothetical protein [Paraliomyxa miuraensis]
MGTVELDPAALRKLGKAQFERFCCDVVLRFELERRHTPPWEHPDDPSGENGQTDGGCDFSVEILHEPRLSLAEFLYAITADEPGLTWYGCKNTKSDTNARKLVLRDVRPTKKKLVEIWDRDGEPPADLAERCLSDGRLSKPLLEVLASGGRYFVLLAA